MIREATLDDFEMGPRGPRWADVKPDTVVVITCPICKGMCQAHKAQAIVDYLSGKPVPGPSEPGSLVVKGTDGPVSAISETEPASLGVICGVCRGARQYGGHVTNERYACRCRPVSEVGEPGWRPGPLTAPRPAGLALDSQGRKDQPLFRGLLAYFPDACAEVSELSRLANEKHNPGEDMHWNRDKSGDELDCVARHVIESGGWIEGEYAKPVRHSTALAWRALANLQKEIERDRGDGKISRGSRKSTAREGEKETK